MKGYQVGKETKYLVNVTSAQHRAAKETLELDTNNVNGDVQF